jgi:hypothetical protein
MPDSGHSQPSGKGANRESPGPGVIRASKIEYIDRFSGAGHPVSMRSSQPPSQNVDAFDVVGERQEGGRRFDRLVQWPAGFLARVAPAD